MQKRSELTREVRQSWGEGGQTVKKSEIPRNLTKMIRNELNSMRKSKRGEGEKEASTSQIKTAQSKGYEDQKQRDGREIVCFIR